MDSDDLNTVMWKNLDLFLNKSTTGDIYDL